MTVLYGHTDAESAYVVDDYPYGRSRTQKRYWIESKPKHGDRLVTQTRNPKTGRWNKPKAGTYSTVLTLYLETQDDGREFVKHRGLGLWRTDQDVQAFLDFIGGAEKLNDVQRVQVAALLGLNKVMESVTFSVREGEQTEAEKQQQAEINAKINSAITAESVRAYRNL